MKFEIGDRVRTIIDQDGIVTELPEAGEPRIYAVTCDNGWETYFFEECLTKKEEKVETVQVGKRFISLTQDWVEKNGVETLTEAITQAEGKVRNSTGSSPAVFYVVEVKKLVKKAPQPTLVIDVVGVKR